MGKRKKRRGRGNNYFLLGFQTLFSKGKPDTFMFILIILLLLFGIILVYDASAVIASQAEDINFDQFFFLKRHLLWIGLGAVVFYLTYSIDYHSYPSYIVPALIVTMGALISVYIFGEEKFGARRWIDVGGFDFQPSELAKLVFTVYLASWLSKQRMVSKNLKDAIRNHFKTELLPFVSILTVICILILFQPDLGTTAIVGFTALAVYFISGTDALHTIGSVMIISIMSVVSGLAAILEDYRLGRVKTYLDTIRTGQVPDKLETGYQIQQMLIAIGSGGLTGLGFAESRQKHGYLVGFTAFTDTIFSVYAEEFGFIGSVFLVIIFLIFILRGFHIANHAPDKLGSLLAAGITIWFGLQIFFNIGANVVLLPLTGIPLPFISYGGSAMVVTMAAMGILLNISRQISK